MAYTMENFRSKKALKAAVLAAQRTGVKVPVFQPGPFGPNVVDGQTAIEGPHYPESHRWYASVMVRDGCIERVLS